MTSPPGSQNVSPALTTRGASPSSSNSISPSNTKPNAGPLWRCGGVPGSPGGNSTATVIACEPGATSGGMASCRTVTAVCHAVLRCFGVVICGSFDCVSRVHLQGRTGPDFVTGLFDELAVGGHLAHEPG